MGNVLRRMSMEIPAVQEADTSSVEFAKKVQDELGYSRLLVAVRTPPAKPLLKALKGIDITPFDIEDVKAYKKSQEYIGMWSGTKEKLKYLAIAVVLIFFSFEHHQLVRWFRLGSQATTEISRVSSACTNL